MFQLIDYKTDTAVCHHVYLIEDFIIHNLLNSRVCHKWNWGFNSFVLEYFDSFRGSKFWKFNFWCFFFIGNPFGDLRISRVQASSNENIESIETSLYIPSFRCNSGHTSKVFGFRRSLIHFSIFDSIFFCRFAIFNLSFSIFRLCLFPFFLFFLIFRFKV